MLSPTNDGSGPLRRRSQPRDPDGEAKQRRRELIASYRETVATLTRAIPYKDGETGAHMGRISYYSVELANTLGLDREFCDAIHYASPLYDVGKLAIPEAILFKPDAFDAHESKVMKSHAALGAKLLRGTESPYLIMGAEIAGGHHECWDGSGYPLGLKGEAIPLTARIVNICDQYDALLSRRPYKQAYAYEKVLEIITVGDGRTLPSHFDPAVLGAFQQCNGRLREIFEAHKDKD